MSPHLDRRWLGATIALWVTAAILFIVLNNAFGGPDISLSSRPYQFSATTSDAQGLLKKSLVLTRGVRVGEVADRYLVGNNVRFSVSIDSAEAPVYRDATVSIRRRTLFGEPYVDLDRGHPQAGALPDHAELSASGVQQSVTLDQALGAFDAPTRQHLSSLGATGATVANSPDATARFSATIAGFGSVLGKLRTVSTELGDQRGSLTRFVTDGRSVLEELASREQALRQLVSGGRITAEAFAAQEAPLRAGLAEMPLLLRSARGALVRARPLLIEARPVINDLANASPALTTAFEQLPAVARLTRSTIARLPSLSAAALPVLSKLGPVVTELGPAVARLEPVLRDLVPIISFTAPYRREVIGLVGGSGAGTERLRPNGTIEHPSSNVQQLQPSVGWQTDNVLFGRFLIEPVPEYSADKPDATTAKNPYPHPNDAFSAYTPGTYPHLTPYPVIP
jgi:phospholipid/cholesterol/gamma-HCH transport system substrate-binding protein